MPGTDDIRARLQRRRRELLRRYRNELDRVEEELAARHPEEAERASEEWDARVLGSLGRADLRSIVAVVDAIARLNQGTYGTCVICRHEIGATRLAAIPETATCIECASIRDGLDAGAA